jgi:hypothetical protein
MSIIRRALITGGAAFGPASYSQLAGRYRTDRAASRYSDLAGTVSASSGGVLGYLDDEAGSYPLVAVSSPARPSLVTVSGIVVARFDGLAHVLRTDLYASRLTVPTTWIVFRVRSGTGTRGYLDARGGSHRLLTYSPSSPASRINGFAGSAVSAGNIADGAWHVIAVARRADGTARVHVDGSALAGDAGDHELDGLTLGALYDLTGYGAIDVAEVCAFDGELADEDLDRLHADYALDVYGDLL